MQPLAITPNQHFIGREQEQARLQGIAAKETPAIIIAYGRRRIGKTELLEQTFKDRHLIKFEGIEGASEDQQMAFVMQQLAHYCNNPLLRKVHTENWVDVFGHIHEYTREGTWTLYFEEVQWLANYEDQFISQLKYAWDNYFRHNPHIIVILCGSAPAYMLNHVVHSKSLYNRSQHEFHLKPLNIIETKQLLNIKNNKEVMNTYLTVGGVPEYLKQLQKDSSIFLSLCRESFCRDGSLTHEYKKIFISSMHRNPHYKRILEYLSHHPYATRSTLTQVLKIQSGGRITELLQDLELSGFITRYTPFNKKNTSKLCRYCISDHYLQFYYKFIKPHGDDIEADRFNKNPTQALKMGLYFQWLGYAFERFCRNHHPVIANLLGFSAVQYQSGAYFKRADREKTAGTQIDLVFDRADNVITVCEVKYYQTKVTKKVVDTFEKKLEELPNPKNKVLHKVLICSEGADNSLKSMCYFDEIITLDDLFQTHYW